MPATFSIAVDVIRSRVTLTLGGFFAPDDVGKVIDGMTDKYRQLRCKAGQHRTLLDTRHLDIQSQDTVLAFAKAVESPRFKSERLAILVARSLVRMQMVRVVAGRDAVRFFKDAQDAHAWLSERAGGDG